MARNGGGIFASRVKNERPFSRDRTLGLFRLFGQCMGTFDEDEPLDMDPTNMAMMLREISYGGAAPPESWALYRRCILDAFQGPEILRKFIQDSGGMSSVWPGGIIDSRFFTRAPKKVNKTKGIAKQRTGLLDFQDWHSGSQEPVRRVWRIGWCHESRNPSGVLDANEIKSQNTFRQLPQTFMAKK